MRVAVLGTGLIGNTIVNELSLSPHVGHVTALDGQEASVECATSGKDPSKVSGKVADLGSKDALVGALKEFDVAIAALPHSLSLLANEAAVEARCHLIDLVGSRYTEKLALDEPARQNDVLLVTGCGVAPGIVNVMAARGIELLDEADEAVMYCGGLPRHPLPPLGYQVVYRLESLLGLYTRPALAAEDGELVQLPPLAGLEDVDFPEPVGQCEAAYSDAHSTAYTLRHRVKRLAEKTVRYKGHFAKMGAVAELGFLSDEPVRVGDQTVVPKEVAIAVLGPLMKGGSEEDVTVVRVSVKGRKDGELASHEWTMVDQYDHSRDYTSMAKTTAFPPVILTEWLAQGLLNERGFLGPEQIVVGDRFDEFMTALESRGVTATYSHGS